MNRNTMVVIVLVIVVVVMGVALFLLNSGDKEQRVKELFHAKYGDNVTIDTFGFYEAAVFEYTADTTSGLIIRMNDRFWILLREPIQE